MEIQLVGNSRSRNVSCFVINKVVDSKICSFKDFVIEIVKKCPPRYGELVIVVYYDSVSNKHIEIKFDQDFLQCLLNKLIENSEHVDCMYAPHTNS